MKRPLITVLLALSLLPQSFAQESKPSPEPKKEYTLKQAKDLMRFLMKPSILKAQRTSAMTAMAQLQAACEDYYEEYQQLPLGSKAVNDAERLTTGAKGLTLMSALVGLKSAEDENYKEQNFFAFKAAKEKKDGLLRAKNSAQLFDPWGNPYYVLLNYDYDQELREPQGIGNQIHYDRHVLIWSKGPDGKSGTPETNKDNLYSWAR